MTNQNMPQLPIQQLDSTATNQQVNAALTTSIQMLVQSGMSRDQAQQMVAQLMQQQMGQMMEGKKSTDYSAAMSHPSSRFARGGGNGAPAGGASGYESVPNVRLNNFNPIQQGDKTVING